LRGLRDAGAMTPLRDLLARIRFDPAFGRARFELAYRDHAAPGLVRVPFDRVRYPADGHYFVEIADPDGATREVPLHRVRVVWRDGVVVWRRPDLPVR
jgi:uncharacterized protein (UPF0248 family)